MILCNSTKAEWDVEVAGLFSVMFLVCSGNQIKLCKALLSVVFTSLVHKHAEVLLKKKWRFSNFVCGGLM